MGWKHLTLGQSGNRFTHPAPHLQAGPYRGTDSVVSHVATRSCPGSLSISPSPPRIYLVLTGRRLPRHRTITDQTNGTFPTPHPPLYPRLARYGKESPHKGPMKITSNPYTVYHNPLPPTPSASRRVDRIGPRPQSSHGIAQMPR